MSVDSKSSIALAASACRRAGLRTATATSIAGMSNSRSVRNHLLRRVVRIGPRIEAAVASTTQLLFLE
jgi:hypothetical protein